jgi:hypothetical protein
MDQTGTIEHDPDINIWRAEQEIMEKAEQSELGASGGARCSFSLSFCKCLLCKFMKSS